MANPIGANSFSKASLLATYTARSTSGNGFSEQPPVAYGNLLAPAAPAVSTATSGGTVLAGVYGVIITYVSANGETVGSVATAWPTTGSTSTLTVTSPAAVLGATGWYAYITQVNGSTYTRQQTAGSPTAIGTNLTLTAPPTSSGLNPQAASNAFVSPGAFVVVHTDPTYRVSFNPNTSVANVECWLPDTATGIYGWQLAVSYIAV